MRIYQLPVPREDESLYSLAVRIRAKNSACNDHDACCAMFANSRSTRVDEFPVDLTHFCTGTRYMFGDEQTILASFTLAAFFKRLGSKVWRSGSMKLSPQQTRYGLLTLSHGVSNRWQYCTTCLKCDRKHWGLGYWRRCHQLPGTLVCPLDGTPLSRARASAAVTHTRFVLPDDVAAGSRRISSAVATKCNVARIADINSSILKHGCEEVDNATLLAVILAELQERGLAQPGGKLRQNEFLRVLRFHHQELCELDEYRPYLDDVGVGRLAAALRRGELPASSLHTVLIIDYLFGSWGTTLEYCKWHDAFNAPPVEAPNAHASPAKETDVCRHHRAICLDLLEAYPTVSRSGFARAVPRSFRWLLANDPEWLSKAVPIHMPSKQQSLL